MNIIHCEQRSDEWFDARMGRPTASNAAKIFTSTGKRAASRKQYLYEVAAERAGYRAPWFEPTEAMLEGIRREEESKDAYAFLRGVEVEEVGLIVCDKTGASASPDGLINREYGLELKNPKASTFFAEQDAGKVPAKYIPQIHFSMAVSRLTRWDYMCYLPGRPPLIHVCEWDSYTDNMLEEVQAFCFDLKVLCAKLGIDSEKTS